MYVLYNVKFCQWQCHVFLVYFLQQLGCYPNVKRGLIDLIGDIELNDWATKVTEVANILLFYIQQLIKQFSFIPYSRICLIVVDNFN